MDHETLRQTATRLAATRVLSSALLVLMCAGCSDSEEPLVSEPPRSPVASESTPPPATWESEYSAEQMAAYRQAFARFVSYQAAAKPVWAAGRATSEAKKLFMEYFIPWQFYYDQLKKYEQAGIRLDVQDKVLDSRATRVKVGSDGASVSIRQCVDQTASSGTQNGRPLPKSFDGPQLVDVVLSQAEGRWLISSISDPAKDRPCDP